MADQKNYDYRQLIIEISYEIHSFDIERTQHKTKRKIYQFWYNKSPGNEVVIKIPD